MTSALIQEAILSGIHFLIIFLILFFLYFIWKTLLLLGDWFIYGNSAAKTDLKILIKNGLLFIFIFIIGFLILSTSINWLNQRVDINILPLNNQSLMSLDKIIFGVYVPFWFQDIQNPLKNLFNFLSPILTSTYRALTAIISLLFLIVLTQNYRRFYQFFLAFVLCLIISLPLWYAIPALTPNHAYYKNILKNPISEPIQTMMANYQPNPNLQKFLFGKINTADLDAYNSILTTTIPSMHVAWATVALYFAIQISWWLGIIMIPYYLLNLIATVFTLQHYAVDSLLGILIGIFALFFSKLIIIKKDSTAALPTITMLIQNDLKFLVKFFKRNN
ncbi:MAG: phosphatase PAP2 family protein [Patescibacteria group bacterium]